jgi:7-keto-8-aminopelargonate synthetase-like enzyme
LNDYLGLAIEVRKADTDAAIKYGAASMGARMMSGHQIP